VIGPLIEAIIHYRHNQAEVSELARAVEPLLDHIQAVGSVSEREALARITGCDYFEQGDVRKVRDMLLRAAKHARNHLGDYFAIVQESVITQAEHLEDAALRYHRRFKQLQANTIPVS
jgi:hypothetical protein